MPKKLFYSSYTFFWTNKANCYQSLKTCEALSEYFDMLYFLYPKSKKNKSNHEILSEYSIKNIFFLKGFFHLKILFLGRKLNLLLSNLIFSLLNTIFLLFQSKDDIYLTRDHLGMSFIAFFKTIGIIKQKIFFEAHYFNPRIGRSAKKFDGLIVINNHLKEKYSIYNSNILVCHDGVDLDFFIPARKKINQIKKILYSGNLWEWKGVDLLIKASSKMRIKHKILIAGGSLDTIKDFDLRNKKHLNQNITLLGHLNKHTLVKIMNESDVFVLPTLSTSELSKYTSPLKLFEYMAMKKIIVASNIDSTKEILSDNYNAIFFQANDYNDLARRLDWVLQNDCSKIIENSYNDVQKYSWSKRAYNIHEFITNRHSK